MAGKGKGRVATYGSPAVKRTKKRVYGMGDNINKLFKKTNTDKRISEQAVLVLNDMALSLIDRIMRAAQIFATANPSSPKKLLTMGLVLHAIRRTVPATHFPRIRDQAIAKAEQLAGLEQRNASRDAKRGITVVSRARVRGLMKKVGLELSLSVASTVAVATTIDVILKDIITGGIENATKEKKKTLFPRHIRDSVKKTPEMLVLFRGGFSSSAPLIREQISAPPARKTKRKRKTPRKKRSAAKPKSRSRSRSPAPSRSPRRVHPKAKAKGL